MAALALVTLYTVRVLFVGLVVFAIALAAYEMCGALRAGGIQVPYDAVGGWFNASC